MDTLTSSASVPTSNASSYLQRLCKHFAHKVAVDYDATAGSAALPGAMARFNATDATLEISLSAERAEGLLRAKHIIEDHLLRFAHRERLSAIDWKDPT